MKTSKFLVRAAVWLGAAIAIGMTSNSWATVVKPPVATTGSTTAEAQAAAEAQAQAQASATATGTGGQGGSVGDVTSSALGGTGGSAVGSGGSSRATGTGGQSYSATGDVLNNIGGSKIFSFAAPAWTKVPSAVDCTHSDAMAWSATVASYSRTKQFTGAVCAMLDMADKADNSCQYGTAALLRREAMQRLVDDMTPEALQAVFPDRPNLSPVACADLLRPRLIMDARPIQPSNGGDINIEVGVKNQCPTPAAPAPRQVARKAQVKPAEKVCK